MDKRDLRKLLDLTNWDKNPRSIKKQDFERLKKQIKELGQYKPLLITKDGIVLGGNMRLRAYKELGIEDVWVSVVDAPTEEKKLEYALSDNDRAGYYDNDLLANLVPEYPDFDWKDYAVDLKPPANLGDLVEQFSPEVEEDEPPAVSEDEPQSKLGEVYQLGRHRLMCGDATKIEDVEKLMNGQKADMVFTDPPYNVGYSNANRPKPSKTDLGTIQNDKMNDAVFKQFISDTLANSFTATKSDSSIYLWYASSSATAILTAFDEGAWKRTQEIIWKKPMLLGRARYQWAHEPCVFAVKGQPFFIEDRKKTTVWDIGGYDKSKNDHPTQKPVRLCSEGILNSSKQEDMVLDLFGGSGSTLIAAEQTNRTCYMMELDPKYCDVIRKRYANYVQNHK